MNESMASRVKEFIVNHWVSWLIELGILSLVAYFTIAETRKTAEQTREMLAKYDAAISKYTREKTKAVDDAAAVGVGAAKEQVEAAKKIGIKGFLRALKKDQETQEENRQE